MNLPIFEEWSADSAPDGIDLPAGVSVKWVFDADYETRGSYGYETAEETRAAEDFELERLESGEWVALGCVIEGRDGTKLDSLWGIVIEPDSVKLAEYFGHSMASPSAPAEAERLYHAAQAELERAAEELIRAKLDAALAEGRH